MASGGLGGRLRNMVGFAFTDAQRLALWDETEGPGRLERWALRSRWRYMANSLSVVLAGVAGVLMSSLVLTPEPEVRFGLLLGVVIGGVLLAPLSGRRWRRDRELYDRWLRTREGRSAS